MCKNATYLRLVIHYDGWLIEQNFCNLFLSNICSILVLLFICYLCVCFVSTAVAVFPVNLTITNHFL